MDPSMSDRAIFDRMDLGDIWLDSGIHRIWKYIYNNKYLCIPDSWLDSIRDFDQKLTSAVF